MAITKTLVLNESDGTGNLTATVAVTSGIDNDLSTTVTSGAVAQVATISAPLTGLGLFYMLAQTATVTACVNATIGGAAATTIVCQPGTPVVWYPNCGYSQTALLGAAVTALYLYGQVTTAQFDVRVLKAG